MKSITRVLWFSFTLFFFQTTFSQVELILSPDPGEGSYGSNPQCFVHYNNEEYFGAEDFWGRGVWKSNGTEEGTVLVTRKIYPRYAIQFMDKLVMLAYEQYANPLYGLWISDGTEEGTTLLCEVNNMSGLPEFTIVEGKLFFKTPEELWVTQGTAETTHLLSSQSLSMTSAQFLTSSGGLLYFSAETESYGIEPWCSDGSIEGTRMLADLNDNHSQPYGFFEGADGLYFIATTDSAAALYLTDGTELGTRQMLTFPKYLEALDHNAENLKEIHILNDTLYFALKNRETLMNDIYCYPGNDSIVLLKSFPNASFQFLARFYPLNGTILFSVAYPNPRSVQELSLMKIDGLDVIQFDSITNSSWNWNPAHAELTDSVIFFEYNRQLWQTNGLPGETRLVSAQYMNTYYQGDQKSFDVVEDQIYLRYMDQTVGDEPWMHSIKDSQTRLLADVNQNKFGANLSIKHSDGQQIYFTARTLEAGTELWKTASNSSFATMIKDINPGAGSSDPVSFLHYNNHLYFSATDQDAVVVNGLHSSSNVWKTDGTLEGTQKAIEVLTGFYKLGYGMLETSEKIELNGKMLFAASESDPEAMDYELMESDGSPEGTKLLKNIYVEPGGLTGYSTPQNFRKSGNQVFFTATSHNTGAELWVSDGTEMGTLLVKDIRPGIYSSLDGRADQVNLTTFGDRLLFTPYDGDHGRELWISDGSDEGTYQLTDITQGYLTAFYHLTAHKDKTYFWIKISDSETIRELWVTDGTVEGTKPLKKVGKPSTPFYTGSIEIPLGIHNDHLYFSGVKDGYGSELWKSDGTPEGTTMVSDIFPGIGPSNPRCFFTYGWKFYFLANVDDFTTALFCSDGTQEGTREVTDWEVSDLRIYSNPVVCGEYLYFRAYHHDSGQGLYRFHLEGLTGLPVQNKSIEIYPNPVKDRLLIQADHLLDESISVVVADLQGRQLHSEKVSDIHSGEYGIDVSFLDRGIYVVTLISGDRIYSEKFVKE